MFELYIANKNYSSWSLRPWILLRQLDIAFREHLVPFGGADDPDNFRSFSPTGKVPCLVDGPLTVWDSLAIVEYVAEQHPAVWPAGRQPRAWARCAAAEMHSGFHALRSRCTMNCGIRVKLPAIATDLGRDLARLEQLWSDGLRRFDGPFLAGGQFSAADAFFAPVALRVQTYGLPLSEPARRYVEQLLALPAMKEWYAAALVEPWREAAHEDEARATGEWLQDLRAPQIE